MSALDELKARVEGRTEGPWEVRDRGIGYEVHGSAGVPVNSGHRETFTLADAELFAAAPKLLAALEAVEELAASAPRVVGFGGVAFSGIVVADDVLKLIEEALS